MKRDLSSLVLQWPSSGLTQKEFCIKHKLPYQTFQYWKRKPQRQTKKSKGFVELLPSTGTSSEPLMELHFANGIRLTFFGRPDLELIQTLTR